MSSLARLDDELVFSAVLIVESGSERHFAGVFVKREHRHGVALEEPIRHRLGLKKGRDFHLAWEARKDTQRIERKGAVLTGSPPTATTCTITAPIFADSITSTEYSDRVNRRSVELPSPLKRIRTVACDCLSARSVCRA